MPQCRDVAALSRPVDDVLTGAKAAAWGLPGFRESRFRNLPQKHGENKRKNVEKKMILRAKKLVKTYILDQLFLIVFGQIFQIVKGTFTDSSLVFDAMFGVPNVSLGTGMRRRCIRLG